MAVKEREKAKAEEELRRMREESSAKKLRVNGSGDSKFSSNVKTGSYGLFPICFVFFFTSAASQDDESEGNIPLFRFISALTLHLFVHFFVWERY